MSVAIRLPEDTAFPTARVTLDGAEYVVSLAWNQRLAKWSLSLADTNGDAIISGVIVVADYPLTLLSRHDARNPPGELMAVDTSGQGLDPHFADMAGDTPRVVLMYTPEDEL